MNDDAIGRRFSAAAQIMTQAGALAASMQPPPGMAAASLKGAQDWVTEADGAVEHFIAERIASLFPEDAFQGEEGGERTRGRAGSSLLWVVDPIDGTANFARGQKRWCVSLGLLAEGQPLLGLLEAPGVGERFAGRLGQGATRNGQALRAAATIDPAAATVEIGWGPKVTSAAYRSMIERVMALGAAPRTGGCGALALADVACGRLDAYIELSINLWDVAGALPLLAEAGAIVSPFLRDGGLTGAIPILATCQGLAGVLTEASKIRALP